MNRMTLKTALVAALAIPLGAGAAWGYDHSFAAHRGAFAQVPVDVRSTALSGAFTGLAAEEAAVSWNPAGLAWLERHGVGFDRTTLYGLVPSTQVTGVMDMGEGFGLGAAGLSTGDDLYQETTVTTAAGIRIDRLLGWESFAHVSLGAAVNLRFVSYGDNATGGARRVTGSAFGYGVDLGAYVESRWIPGLTLGVVGRDLLNHMAWDATRANGGSEALPRTMRAGAAWRFSERVMVSADYAPGLYGGIPDRFAAGVEYRVLKPLVLRAGTARSMGTTWANEQFTFGFGLEPNLKGTATVEIGLARVINELAGSTHLGIAFRW